MSDLSEQKCVPCRGGEPALSNQEVSQLKPEIPEWSIIKREGIPRLERIFKFSDFASALRFTNQIGQIAEVEDHHPSLLTEWGKVTVTWWTHAVKGLHKNDFIMAAKTDREYQQTSRSLS